MGRRKGGRGYRMLREPAYGAAVEDFVCIRMETIRKGGNGVEDKVDNLILKIQSSYNQLTKAEKKVADYVIHNQKKVVYMSITDLADACDVGDTSVYRFCRTMHLQGYQDFKMKLSLSIGVDHGILKSTEMLHDTEDRFAGLAENIMDLHLSAIRETYMLLDRESFDKILKMFNEANHVYFFGIGDSLLTAEEARNKFLRITNKVSCISDPHMQAMAASMASEKDFIIFISYSGATKDNIHVAKSAKEAGAKMACITHYHKSPLTAYCDGVLLCGSEEGPLEGGSMSAKMSQLYLIDLLYQHFYENNYAACKKNNEATSRAVVEKLL